MAGVLLDKSLSYNTGTNLHDPSLKKISVNKSSGVQYALQSYVGIESRLSILSSRQKAVQNL